MNPNQTTYNGLKLYGYRGPSGVPYSDSDFLFLIRKAESDAENELENAAYFEAKGWADAARSFREGAQREREIANNMKTRYAYICTLRALHPALEEKVLKESR